jgi:hypothetical protein
MGAAYLEFLSILLRGMHQSKSQVAGKTRIFPSKSDSPENSAKKEGFSVSRVADANDVGAEVSLTELRRTYELQNEQYASLIECTVCGSE